MWTETEPPGARVPMVQVRVWDPAVPLMEQPATGVVMDHTTPDPAGPGGRGSVMTTPVASPLELLDPVSVKPRLLPAATLAASAVCKMVRTTPTTAVWAVEVWLAALVALTLAVLL